MFARAPPRFPRISNSALSTSPFRTPFGTSGVSHVHRSPRHRGRRASPPRRFVCTGCSVGNWTAAGDRCWLGCVVYGPDGVGRSARSAPRRRFLETISFGLQPSGSSSQPSPRRFQTISLRNRWPGAQLSNECLHRLSCTSFPTPSSPPRFPTSQVRHPRLRARACMGIMGGLGQSVYQLIFKTKSFVSTLPCTRIDI